ncbi:MAG TPA: sugar transferase, partial [Patescibacteria group bacterium]
MVYTTVKKSTFYEVSKRGIDIILSIFSLLFFLPIMLLVTICIKLESEGPVFADTPSRVGKNGKTFKMYKFRSMVQNAHHLLRDDPHYANLYNIYKKSSYKLREDPRIT